MKIGIATFFLLAALCSGCTTFINSFPQHNLNSYTKNWRIQTKSTEKSTIKVYQINSDQIALYHRSQRLNMKEVNLRELEDALIVSQEKVAEIITAIDTIKQLKEMESIGNGQLFEYILINQPNGVVASTTSGGSDDSGVSLPVVNAGARVLFRVQYQDKGKIFLANQTKGDNSPPSPVSTSIILCQVMDSFFNIQIQDLEQLKEDLSK